MRNNGSFVQSFRGSKILLSVFLSLSTYSPINALIVGSDTVVSIVLFTSFPEIDLVNPNEIRAFGFMKNGFDLENSNTILSFQSIYPVLGTVDFNGGEVTLETDLIFAKGTTLNGLGSIIGQGHVVKFASDITSLPSDTASFRDVHIISEANELQINSEITFRGSNFLTANGIKLGDAGALIIDSNATLHLQSMFIKGIRENNIRGVDDTAHLILEGVKWLQDQHFTFSSGAITFEDRVSFSGTGTFVYESSQTSTITVDSQLKFDSNFTFSYYPDSENPTLLELEDKTAKLVLRGANLFFSIGGLSFSKGKIVVRNATNIWGDIEKLSDGTFTNVGLSLGKNSQLLDCALLVEKGSQLNIRRGALNYKNVREASLDFEDSDSILFLAQDTRLRVENSMDISPGRIHFERGAHINKFNGAQIIAPIFVK